MSITAPKPACDRIPVIIGVGDLRDKPADPRDGLEPLDLLIKAARAADADAGGQALRQVDCLRVVNQISWRYRDLPALLAKRLRLRGAETLYGAVGGESPVRMLVDAAQDIATGHSEFALLCGAESLRSAAAWAATGQAPPWTDEDPDAVLPRAEQYVSDLAARYGLVNPVDVYPLYENALRAHRGETLDQAQAHTAWLWAQMAAQAAMRPAAWSGRAMSEQALLSADGGNRMVSFPYRKLTVAQMAVNQAAAVILTHRDAALAMGIAAQRLIYIGAGAGAQEHNDFLQRAAFTAAPALALTLQRTLELNGLHATQLDALELYSCFPCVPKLALAALGLPPRTPVSVTGGLSAFGGPGNNYMSHAIVAMTQTLRGTKARYGLLYGNGAFLTHHHATVLAHEPLPDVPRNHNLQPDLEADAAAPTLLEDYEGAAKLETFSLSYRADGQPERATVLARTPAGERVVARIGESQPQDLAWLGSGAEEPAGTVGCIYDGRDGCLHWARKRPETLPEPAVLIECPVPHVAVVTLNRPQRRNAVDGALTRLLAQAVKRVERDPEIRVAILTGAAGDAFCAGADLEAAARRSGDLLAGASGFAGFVNAKRTKPWIAAVNGPALGGGTELVLACDLAIAGRSASFGLPEIKLGLLAAAGGAYRLPRVIPSRAAAEWILTGRSVDADEAQALHLVNTVVADDELQASALDLASAIAAHDPAAISAALDVLHRSFDERDADLAARSVTAAVRLLNSRRSGNRPAGVAKTGAPDRGQKADA